jgi:phage terminase large subunit-like protein
VCNEVYIQVARKAGKDAFIAAIALYMLIADGENAPEIACLANSREQGRILFNYITKFAHSLDPQNEKIKPYRNYINFPSNDGVVKVFSADASKLDGLNASVAVIDEFHEARDRKLYDVMKSSQGMREQPLMVIITTAGFNLDGPCHDMYELGIQILAGVKEMDNLFYFIFELDVEDDWTDPKNFIKCQPNLGVTVTEDFMIAEVNKAQVDSTALTGVLTKTLNKWVQSKVTWIPQTVIANLMRPIDMEEFRGKNVIAAADLSSVGDLTSLSIMLPPDDTCKYMFKTWTFLPEDSIVNHPNRALYEKFVQEGSMITTPGNVCDYDFILHKIWEINQICPIAALYVDRWNATQFQISATEAGFNVQEFSQAVGNYNAATKEFERLARAGEMIIDKNANVLWQFGNACLKGDINGNQKVAKESPSSGKKVDSVISMTTCLGGYLKNPVDNDYNIFVI